MALVRMSLLERPSKLRKVSGHCICSFKVRNIDGGQQTVVHRKQ